MKEIILLVISSIVIAIGLKRFSRRSSSKFLKIITALFYTALGSMSIIFIVIQVIIAIHCKSLPAYTEVGQYRYMIILGAGLDGDQVSQRLKGRLDEALKYYHYYDKEIIIIVSGGQGEDELISEAEAMKRYLIEEGVDASHIIKEEHSTSTKENIKFSKEILRELDALDEKVLIVTSDYHSLRTYLVAHALGLKNENLVYRNSTFVRVRYSIRESLALVKDIIMMYIINNICYN